MNIQYEILSEADAYRVRELCNELMAFQKSKSTIRTELFDSMCFETRMLPSLTGAKHNFIVLAKDGDTPIGYVYSNICHKSVYNSAFADFFDLGSVKGEDVGCLSQFFIREGYRGTGVGTALFEMSMNWLSSFKEIEDLFIYVSNGNTNALEFYKSKGFKVSHDILDGFITVLRNN